MRFALACATALLSLALAAPASPGAEPEPADAAAKKKAGKSKKCKAGKVAVTLNGRRRCQSLRAALPRPKAADPRLLAAKAALGVDLGNLRDRGGVVLRICGRRPEEGGNQGRGLRREDRRRDRRRSDRYRPRGRGRPRGN